jgi:hypothetical protein
LAATSEEERKMDGWYSALGLLVGIFFLAVGFVCMLRQHAGDTAFQATVWGFKFEIKTTVPGVIFTVLGVLVIYLTHAH